MASIYYISSMLLTEKGLQIWTSTTTEYTGNWHRMFLQLHMTSLTQFWPKHTIHKNSIQWVPRTLCFRIKQPGYEADHSPPPRTKGNNHWTKPPIPFHAFMMYRDVTFIFHRNSNRCQKVCLCNNKHSEIVTNTLQLTEF